MMITNKSYSLLKKQSLRNPIKAIFILCALILFQFTNANAQIDLKLDTILYTTTSDTNIHHYYSAIPWSLAKLDSVNFSAVVTNLGSNTATNVYLQNVITTPTSADTLNSDSVTLNPNQTDTLYFSQNFSFQDSIGNYSWYFNVMSDSTDTNPNNNFKDIVNVIVSDTTFARDHDNFGNFQFGNLSGEYGVMYEIKDTVKATSISVSLGTDSEIGALISLYLYNDSLQYLTGYEFISISQFDTTIRIPEEILPPGKYYVTVKSFSDDVYFKKSPFMADSGTSIVDTNSSGTFQNFPYIVPVRLNVSTNLIPCVLKPGFSYFGLYGCDKVDLNPIDGIPPYSFLWDNGDTTNYFYGLTQFWGGLNVKITDSNGCHKTFTAACYLSTEENSMGEISISPNPTHERLNLNMESVLPGKYQIRITSVVGKSVFQRDIMVQSSLNETIELTGFQKGVYFVEIVNSNGNKSVTKLMVN